MARSGDSIAGARGSDSGADARSSEMLMREESVLQLEKRLVQVPECV